MCESAVPLGDSNTLCTVSESAALGDSNSLGAHLPKLGRGGSRSGALRSAGTHFPDRRGGRRNSASSRTECDGSGPVGAADAV